MPELKIAPSILASDFSRLGEEIEAVVEAGADWIHAGYCRPRFSPTPAAGFRSAIFCPTYNRILIFGSLLSTTPTSGQLCIRFLIIT